MSRLLLAGIALVACIAVVVLVLVLGGGDESKDPTAGVERKLRQALTRPGPDQITPNGEKPKSIDCRGRGDRRWLCDVRYPGGTRVRCLVGERPLDQGPICE